MIDFIVKRIKLQADISVDKGIEKYKAFFIKTKIYKKYREDVDKILRDDGYENIIVE